MRKLGARLLCLLLAVCLLGGCGSAEPTWQEQYDLGVRYLSEGNYEQAVIAFTAAIEIDPKRPETYLGRAQAYVGLGGSEENLEAARADYETALDLDDSLIEAWLGLADVYILKGDTDKAREILEEAADKTDGDPDVLERLEELEEQAKENLPAWQQLEAFVQEGGYLPYLDGWIYGQPEAYALMDLSGDREKELLIVGNTQTGFYDFMVFYLDQSGEIRPASIENPSSGTGTVGQYYGDVTYSPTHHALVYTDMNNGSMFGGVDFHLLLETGELTCCFSYGFETNPQTMEQSYTFVTDDGQVVPITQGEYQRVVVTEPKEIEFNPLPSTGGQTGTTGGQSGSPGQNDLSSLMGRNIYEVVAEVPGMTDSGNTDGTTGFYNDFLLISTDYDSELIRFVSLEGESDFTLWGVSFGMAWEEARDTVLQFGWTSLSETENRILFEREDGSQLSVYAEDGQTVSGISLFAP